MKVQASAKATSVASISARCSGVCASLQASVRMVSIENIISHTNVTYQRRLKPWKAFPPLPLNGRGFHGLKPRGFCDQLGGGTRALPPRPPVAPVRPDRHAPGPKRPHASSWSGRQPATRQLSPRDSGKRLPYSKPSRRSPLSLWCHPQKLRNPRGSCALWIIFYSTFTTLLQNLYDTVRHLLVSSSVPGSAGGYEEQPLA